MPNNWSTLEVEAIVSDYFAMLTKQLAGIAYNKAAHRRALLPLLRNRSEQSIEFKHANISAVLLDLGYIPIDGYKPRSNYQELLRDVVSSRLVGNLELARLAETVVDAVVQSVEVARSESAQFVPAPTRTETRARIYERVNTKPPMLGVNYLQREARNASLGLAGEQLVLSMEHQRLWESGKRTLAERIEHVSSTKGDGLGYDILSFEDSGRERLIEVKTTRLGQFTPFFASKNEVLVSEREHDRYHVYRVYKFGTAPKVFLLPGSLKTSTGLDAVVYRASIL